MKLDQETILDLLKYNPKTGQFFWNKRNRKYFKCERSFNIWNSRYSGKECFLTTDNLGRKTTSIFNKPYRAHIIAFLYMTGRWPKEEIDHEDGNPSNNKWENLVEVSHSDNMKNLKIRKDNTSGHQGISWDKSRKKWKVQVSINGVNTFICRTKNLQDAIARRAAANNKFLFHHNHGKR